MYNKLMNHDQLKLADKITAVGELEHLRRHLIRAAITTTDDTRAFFYLVKAHRAEALRRQLQHSLPEVAEEDWCIVKSCATIKQLNAETLEEDKELYKEIEDLADDCLSKAYNVDFHSCKACKDDKDNG